MTYKLINGQIFDPKTKSFKEEDLLIEDGKVLARGKNLPPADQEIDVAGKIISPGFIDIHMHEEERALLKEEDYDIAISMVQMGVTTAMGGNCGSAKTPAKDFIDHLDRQGAPINYLLSVGYNDLRSAILPQDQASPQEADYAQLKEAIARDIDLGAVGISFGIEYTPSISQEEILRVLEDYRGREDLLVSAHYRADGPRALEAVEEMCQIGQKSQIPFQISHLSSCSAFGNMAEVLDRISHYRDQGVNVEVDAYPYDGFSTSVGSEVFAGDFEKTLADWQAHWEDITLKGAPYYNQTLTPQLLEEVRDHHPHMLAVARVMNEEEVKLALRAPFVFVASDGLYRHHKGHPRGAGTFPRVLGAYVREDGVLSLEEALYKMTYQPAKRLGLEKRKGALDPGYDADLVVFDPDQVLDQADYEDGKKPPLGIDYVFVDGVLTVKDGHHLGPCPGRFIRREER
ncbi:MAG: amidohydrolase family protein [Tissierellia bacterium]|nr:amidohydrolase family protein [Tissierellia bacterium]